MGDIDLRPGGIVHGNKDFSQLFSDGKETVRSSLYKKKKEEMKKLKPSQLHIQESHQYKAFGKALVIQGVEDNFAPNSYFYPSHRMSLQSSLCLSESLKLAALGLINTLFMNPHSPC